MATASQTVQPTAARKNLANEIWQVAELLRKDGEVADRLFRDSDAMDSYTRTVFRIIARGIDRDDLMGMSG